MPVHTAGFWFAAFPDGAATLIGVLATWNMHSILELLREPFQQPLGVMIRGSMVLACYLMWLVAYGIMIVQGFRQKSYGMPPIGAAAILAINGIAVYGPFSNQTHLFYYKENYTLLAIWSLQTLLQAIVFVQYLMYGREKGHPIGQVHKYFYVVAVGTVAAFAYTFWTFIGYYQDYYINEICPIALLVASATFFATLHNRPDLRGLSMTVGWLIAVGDLLLYSAVVLGDMSDPYPDASFGYGLIYWIYFITLVLNFTYAVLLTRRRHELRADPPGTRVALAQ